MILAASVSALATPETAYFYDSASNSIRGCDLTPGAQARTMWSGVTGPISLTCDVTKKNLYYVSSSGPDKGWLVTLDISQLPVKKTRILLPQDSRDLNVICFGPNDNLWLAYSSADYDSFIHEFTASGQPTGSEIQGRWTGGGFNCIAKGDPGELLFSSYGYGNARTFIGTTSPCSNYQTQVIAIGDGATSIGMARFGTNILTIDSSGVLNDYAPASQVWTMPIHLKCCAEGQQKSLAKGNQNLCYVLSVSGLGGSTVQCIDLTMLVMGNDPNNYTAISSQMIKIWTMSLPFPASNMTLGPPMPTLPIG